ncbi:MAG: RNA polymerase sigma factor [Planctomycetes bacterium]|nr:RNA polymerase sigma factor [Planctomycetota bacterium]
MSPSGRVEAEVVRRVAAGDREAFALVVRAYQGELLALAWRLLGDRHAAEDAVQDSLLAAFRTAREVTPAKGWRPWLLTITLNRCRDRLRARLRRPRGLDPEILALRAAGDPGPRDAAEEGERRDEVRRALGELPSRLREAVVLHVHHGLSFTQSASVLGVPVSTLKSRVAAALARLERRLRGVGHGL